MSQAEDGGAVQVEPEDLESLKWDLLATGCNETCSRLLLFQQLLRRRAARSNRSKKLPNYSSFSHCKEPMPPEEVLNDIKLNREIDALRNIFNLAFAELTTEKFNKETPYLAILKAIEDYSHTSNEAEMLAQELEENKSAFKHLKAQQLQQEIEISEKLSQRKQRVLELRDELKQIQCINRLELKLVEKWEANRLSQATMMGEIEERLLMQQILNINRRIAGEQRLINEIEAFRINEISELKQKIEEWEEKFKLENTLKSAENKTLSQNIADVIKTHEKYREVMDQRQLFVAEYLKQKAEEQRLYEEQCYRVNCAIRIQAWWRGTMVRQGLGPYRKKSKKGKKSKKK